MIRSAVWLYCSSFSLINPMDQPLQGLHFPPHYPHKV